MSELIIKRERERIPCLCPSPALGIKCLGTEGPGWARAVLRKLTAWEQFLISYRSNVLPYELFNKSLSQLTLNCPLYLIDSCQNCFLRYHGLQMQNLAPGACLLVSLRTFPERGENPRKWFIFREDLLVKIVKAKDLIEEELRKREML